MIKVQDWVASIPDEEKHIAYVGEGLTEQREFLLCGDGWERYADYSFHLDIAFDPESITTRDSRQVVQTTFNSTEQKEEAGVIIDEVTTKETYTVDNVQTTNHNLTDIAPLSKVVAEDGIHLTWMVLRQHTVLPGKLWATIRAVGSESGQVKKSAIMTFEVESAICAVSAAVPPISEFEQMEREMDALRQQAVQAASTATNAADSALQASASAHTIADVALGRMYQAEAAAEQASKDANRATSAAEQAISAAASAQIAADATTNHVVQADKHRAQAAIAAANATDAATRTSEYMQGTVAAAQQAAVSTEGARYFSDAAGNAATQCRHYAQLCETYAGNVVPNPADPDQLDYRRINVRDYGATGDGVTDDQPAIWAAITAAKALIAQDVPCEIYFPAGTYGILNGGMAIRLPQGKGGLLIRGAGREITTIKYLDDWQAGGNYGNGWYALDIAPEGNFEYENLSTYIHDVAVTGLTIRDDYPDKHATHSAKGNAATAGQGEENHGVNIGGCIRVAVTDCAFINMGDETIDIGCCTDIVVLNNHLEGCPAAGPGGGAIAIIDGSENAVVSGNTITRTGADYVLTAEDFDGADGITIPAGTEMSGGVELPDGTVIGRYTKLTEDTYIPVGTKILKTNYAVTVESLLVPVRNVVITGNTIRDIHGKAMSLNCPNNGSSIDNVIIADNVMVGCDDGICMEGTYTKRGIKIQNNIIADCLGEAVWTNAVEDITISGNTFRNIKGGNAINTANQAANTRLLLSDCVFENIENMAVYCGGNTVMKDCVFNGVGTAETPLATPNPAITKSTGTLTVSGCVLKDIRLNGTKGGIQNADYIEHTDIELISKTGVANAGGDAIKGTTKRIIGGTMGGRIAVSQPNAIVQGVTIVSTNIGGSALTVSGDNTAVADCHFQVNQNNVIAVNANGVSVTGCHIEVAQASTTGNAIKEADGKNHNLFANNIVNRAIATVGAQSVAVNNIDTRMTA